MKRRAVLVGGRMGEKAETAAANKSKLRRDRIIMIGCDKESAGESIDKGG
jgi:hypothetical protein